MSINEQVIAFIEQQICDMITLVCFPVLYSSGASVPSSKFKAARSTRVTLCK